MKKYIFKSSTRGVYAIDEYQPAVGNSIQEAWETLKNKHYYSLFTITK